MMAPPPSSPIAPRLPRRSCKRWLRSRRCVRSRCTTRPWPPRSAARGCCGGCTGRFAAACASDKAAGAGGESPPEAEAGAGEEAVDAPAVEEQASEAYEATCRKVSGAPAAREEPQEPWVRERGIGKVCRRTDSVTFQFCHSKAAVAGLALALAFGAPCSSSSWAVPSSDQFWTLLMSTACLPLWASPSSF